MDRQMDGWLFCFMYMITKTINYVIVHTLQTMCMFTIVNEYISYLFAENRFKKIMKRNILLHSIIVLAT